MSVENPVDRPPRGVVGSTVTAARVGSRVFWSWWEEHHVDSLAVLGVSLALTVRVVEWALDYSYDEIKGISGMEKAAILGAVLTPWGLMQAALFKFYAELKAKGQPPAQEITGGSRG